MGCHGSHGFHIAQTGDFFIHLGGPREQFKIVLVVQGRSN